MAHTKFSHVHHPPASLFSCPSPSSMTVPLLFLSLVSLFSHLGVLLRIIISSYFESITLTSPLSPFPPSLPPNLIGSFLLGLLTSGFPSNLLTSSLSTGFLSSLTSFASWSLQITTLLIFPLPFHALFSLILTLSSSLAFFRLGTHLGGFYHNYRPPKPPTPDSPPPKFLVFVLAPLALAVWIACILLTIFLRGKWRFHAAAMSFAPIGATLRAWLTRFNPPGDAFKMGTFAANITGVVLDLAIAAALVIRTEVRGPTEELLLGAVIAGKAGALSTVSTFMKEIHEMESKAAKWRYVTTTFAVSQALGLAIYGIAYWLFTPWVVKGILPSCLSSYFSLTFMNRIAELCVSELVIVAIFPYRQCNTTPMNG